MNPIDWQARAVAAEVALERLRDAAEKHLDMDHNHEAGLIPFGTRGWLRRVAKDLPDLTAARELIRKAGEAEGLAMLVTELREALSLLIGSCIYYSGDLTVPSKYVVISAKAALALTLPEAAQRVAEWKEKATFDYTKFDLQHAINNVEYLIKSGSIPGSSNRAALKSVMKDYHTMRAFCDAALAYSDAKASIEPQSAEYKRTLAALQAARGTK